MKRNVMSWIMLPLCAAFLFACSEVKTDAHKLEGKWNITKVKGEEILKEGMPNVNFDMNTNKANGNAGCNIFNTNITLDSTDVSKVSFSLGATTMMTCPNMATETAVLAALSTVVSVKAVSDNEMELLDNQGNPVLTLSK